MANNTYNLYSKIKIFFNKTRLHHKNPNPCQEYAFLCLPLLSNCYIEYFYIRSDSKQKKNK